MKSFIVAATISLVAFSAHAQSYDVVILNGRVMDPETGFDQIANVGINNGWITAITTEAIEGAETIDATNHVVAPGFIDLEQHGLDPGRVVAGALPSARRRSGLLLPAGPLPFCVPSAASFRKAVNCVFHHL